MSNDLAIFEDYNIRRIYDEETEMWFFSVVDIIQVLIQQPDYQAVRKYWNKLKERLKSEGSEAVTNCHQLKMIAENGKLRLTDTAKEGDEFAILTNIIHQEWADISIKDHKKLKGLKTQNLRDHMSEAELIFTALAELSTRQIAESTNATGMPENEDVGRKVMT